jgi:hypothetical protein
MTSLSPRHLRFVHAYLRCGNATQAAREAGCPEASADVTAARWLKRPAIRAAIEAAQQDLESLFREEAVASLRTLVAIRDDPHAPAMARLRAAQDLLDRAGYRPAERLEHVGHMQVEHDVPAAEINAVLAALSYDPLGTTLPSTLADAPPDAH